jgi:hypothetical protein
MAAPIAPVPRSTARDASRSTAGGSYPARVCRFSSPARLSGETDCPLKILGDCVCHIEDNVFHWSKDMERKLMADGWT